MSAFHSGVRFLAVGESGLAEECFRRVARECPGCADAWLNLGIACLGGYIGRLDPDDLPAAGPLATGLPRRRAGLGSGTSSAETLWWRAVGALREALRLEPGAAAAQEYLALAYLLGPDNRDRARAVELLEKLVNQTPPDALAAERRLNLAAALLAVGRRDEGLRQLDRAAEAAKALRPAEAAELTAVLAAQRALALAGGADVADRHQAAGLLETYLEATGPSAWWPGVAERYAGLSRELGRPAKPLNQLRQRAGRPRPVAAVELTPGRTIAVGDPADAVLARLNPDRVVHALLGTNLRRLAFDRPGVEVLAGDEVLLILLTSPRAPALPLRSGVPVTAKLPAGGLRAGLSRAEVESLLAGAPLVRLRPAGAPPFDSIPAWGIALRFDRPGPDSRVVEVAIGPTPRAGG
jgi:tetratricopeptide (TPR) repeat protein